METNSNGLNNELQNSEVQQKTVQIRVKMVCKGCGKYIEKIILEIEGTFFAHADHKNGLVEISYNPGKTNLSEIEKAISEGGYDTLNHKRTIEFYTDKPKCCEYREELANDDIIG